MNPKLIVILIVAALAAGGTYWFTTQGTPANLAKVEPAEGEAHADEHNDHAEGESHDEAQRTTITAQAAKASGILAEEATTHALRETLPLTGRIILNPNASAEIKARFPGVVRKVEKAVGQTVKKGEALAYVESNDSLQTYAVTSPLTGIVLTRTTNVGDTAAEQPMFTVANLGSVMAELHVFPKDLARIRTGQTVQVQSVDGEVSADGKVTALLPLADTESQTVVAWVLLENAQDVWRPGMAIQAGAVVNEQDVPVAVRTIALQTLEDATVVFVKEGDTYEARPVKTGRTDGTWTEITEGVTAGETYVSKNSFVVKADIGKAGAEHSH